MNDSDRPPTPHPPYDELRSVLGEHAEGQAALEDLRAALNEPAPQAGQVTASVERLRTIPVLEARIANWWDAPRTQNWLMILSDAGL
jgi:hypothetical protein